MRWQRENLDSILLAVCWMTIVSTSASALPVLNDVSTQAGITAVHHERFYITGQAWGDYDRDGCVDLYLTDLSGPNTLYRNGCDGTFSVSIYSNQVAEEIEHSGGAVFADYDNDGWLDLYVAGGGANSLYRNLQGLGFQNVTVASGATDDGQGESAAWGDYDNDGDLDLFVVNYNDFDTLFRSDGDGTFTEVTSLLGATEVRPGFAASFLDFDNDGDLDIYAVNDRLFGNSLYRNDGAGCGGWCFEDIAVAAGAFHPVYGMGLAVGDYDDDGDLDLYFSSIGEMVLLRNLTSQGSPTFEEAGIAAGVTLDTAGWGTVFVDYDSDGFLDLYLSTMFDDPGKTNRLFRNLGDGTFEDVSESCGASNPGPSIGVATADYDHDGHPDLVVANYGVEYVLYRNDGAGAGNQLTVTLEGYGSVNRDALGARVYLETDDGRKQMRELKSGSSIGSGNEISLHFGIGDRVVTGLEVAWPNGLHEALEPQQGGFLHLSYPGIFGDGFESGDLSSWSSD